MIASLWHPPGLLKEQIEKKNSRFNFSKLWDICAHYVQQQVNHWFDEHLQITVDKKYKLKPNSKCWESLSILCCHLFSNFCDKLIVKQQLPCRKFVLQEWFHRFGISNALLQRQYVFKHLIGHRLPIQSEDCISLIVKKLKPKQYLLNNLQAVSNVEMAEID